MNFTSTTNPNALIYTVNATKDSSLTLIASHTVSLVNQTYTAGDIYELRTFTNGTDKYLLRF